MAEGKDVTFASPISWKICPTPAPGSSDGTKWGVKQLPDEPASTTTEMKEVMVDGLGGQAK